MNAGSICHGCGKNEYWCECALTPEPLVPASGSPPTKYLLIQHGEGGDPALVSIHDTEQERDIATMDAIFGEHTPANDDMLATLHLLKEEGIINFEGDPPVEWLKAKVVNSQLSDGS